MSKLSQLVLSFTDRINFFLSRLAISMLVVMMSITLIEVVLRKLFGSPTLWANDIIYMLNGTLFLLSAGYALRKNAHVRIDFIATRLPARLRNGLELLLYTLLIIPTISLIAFAASEKTIKAFVNQEVETMSAWEPLVWPFYLGISLGLWGLALQLLSDSARHLRGTLNTGSEHGDKDG